MKEPDHPVICALTALAVVGLFALGPEGLALLIGGCLFLAAGYAVLHAIFRG